MRRGINQKVVYGLNPLPPVTEAVLLKRAKLDLITASERSPFSAKWQYSSGAEREDMTLEPGQHLTLREHPESKEFLAEFREIGFVVVEDISNREEVVRKSIEGLRVAQRFYTENGRAKALKLGREASPNRGADQVEGEFRYDYYPYFLNQAKADAIADHLKNLGQELAKLEKARAEE